MIQSADQENVTLSVGSFSMLGWALNEKDSISGYIDRAERFLQTLTSDYELIVIDDGSTDGTAAIVREYQKTRPWLRLYENGRNRGSGYNTKKAISLATKASRAGCASKDSAISRRRR